MANLHGYSFKKCDSCEKGIRMHYGTNKFERLCYSCYRRNIMDNRLKNHYDIIMEIKR